MGFALEIPSLGKDFVAVSSVILRQGLAGGLRVELELGEDRDRVNRSQHGGDWMGGKCVLHADDGALKLDWLGTGWKPFLSPPGGGLRVGSLYATIVEPNLRSWLAARDITDRPLVYQRLPTEKPWDFLSRAAGGYLLGGPVETDEYWEWVIPPGAAWVRPRNLNNAEFLSWLFRCLRSRHPGIEGWVPLLSGILLLTSGADGAQQPFDLAGWRPGAQGIAVEPQGMESSARHSWEVSCALPISQRPGDYVRSFIGADGVTFPLSEASFVCLRTPWLVRLQQFLPPGEDRVLVAREISCQLLSVKGDPNAPGGADSYRGTLTLRLSHPTGVEADSPSAAPMFVPAAFEKWQSGVWASFKPAPQDSSPWQVLNQWKGQPDLQANGLQVLISVPGAGKEGLLFQRQVDGSHWLYFTPGLPPISMGICQKDGDMPDAAVHAILRTVGKGIWEGTELALAPQGTKVSVLEKAVIQPAETVFSHKVKVKDVEIG